MSFLNEIVMSGTNWRVLERSVARIMSHCGWREVRIIGRSGDGGGDVLGLRTEDGRERVFVTQVKAVTGDRYVGVGAIQQCLEALRMYSGHVAVAATNGDFTASAYSRRDQLRREGFDVRLWNGIFLQQLLDMWPEDHFQRKTLRPYQDEIVRKCLEKVESGSRRSQFVVATGLGKTVIAAEIIREMLCQGARRALVLCHSQLLALQLEQQMWTQLGKSIQTRVFFNGLPPAPVDGVTIGLYQTFAAYLSSVQPDDYDIVVIDEAHHAMAYGFQRCITYLRPRLLVGMTATPWRGDGSLIDTLFDPPVVQVSLVDGMQMGYLANVDYRLYFDTVDWADIPRLTNGQMTVRDLNRYLFVPQRDEAVIQEIKLAAAQVADPHIIVFCPSIEHCRRFAALFRSATDMVCRSLSGEDPVTRNRILMEFASGSVHAVCAVDVLNEGIDMPDANILVFLRATHSRRIFVQQLGRGLRLSERKSRVLVLDFATDIRRIADVLQMDAQVRRPRDGYQTVFFPDGIVRVVTDRSLPFIEQWIKDVADLGDADDSYLLTFPEGL